MFERISFCKSDQKKPSFVLKKDTAAQSLPLSIGNAKFERALEMKILAIPGKPVLKNIILNRLDLDPNNHPSFHNDITYQPSKIEDKTLFPS